MKAAVCIVGLLFVGACASEQPIAPPAPIIAQAQTPPKRVAARGPLRPPAKVPSAGPLKLAMVGSYMDAQEKDFRGRLRGAPIMRVGDDLVVSLRNDALFSGEALSGRGRDTIERLAELLRHYDRSAVQVSGYTDNVGPPDRSLALTQQHAKTVADTLKSDGVAADRVSSQGLGATHPKFPAAPNTSEPRNRRIEIRVIAHPQA